MNPLRLVFVEPKGGGKIQDGVTVTPTKEEQTVEPDPGFDGFSAVTVEAIPDTYQDVTGVNAEAEDIRVGKVGIDAHGNLLNGEMLPRKPEQEKSVIPMKQAQTVSPDPGYALSAVNVAKIPDAYQDVSFVDAGAADIRVGKTGVSATGERLDGQMLPQKPEQVKSATPTTAPQSVTPDTGYALSRVDVGAIPSEYADVSDVTATAGTVLTGSDFVDASGTLVHGACAYDADTSDADATAEQIEAGATAYVGGAKVTGTMPVRSADVEISDLSPVPIPAGSYDGTAQAKLSSSAAAEVVAANIRQGAEILGVQGSYQGADTLGQLIEDTLTSYANSTAPSIKAHLFELSSIQTADFSECISVGAYAFHQCASLTEIDIPECTSVGDYAFQQCASLTEIDIPECISVGAYAFHQCASLTEIDIPECTSVGSYAFSFCPLLTRANIPLLTELKYECFRNSGLLAANFPNVTTVGQLMFQDCRDLQSVSMPLATYINGFSFRNCPSLTDVYLPLFATAGDRCMFSRCTSLEEIELPSLTDTKESYGPDGGMFGYCTSLKKVDFGALTRLGASCFVNDTAFVTLIIRTNTVATLSNTNAFNGTPFALGGTGGTLYIKKSLYDHLGDGTADDYLSATNWSVVFSANQNNQILPIEGSPYEVTT